ncbi:hypothetical protein [Streptomyces sp. enrichment culture]|uniref:hypothetical protein n=1 Tax=Streptomyces sp. enrichment culture TaxID=1795815 RepID=UPI003F57C616
MRTRTTAAAYLTTATLLLTACGGSDTEDKANDKIAGADTGTTSPTAPAPASPTEDGIDRPEVTLPAGVDNVFEGAKTGDPVKDEVLADNERRIDAESDAILRGEPDSKALSFYSTGEVRLAAAEYVQSFLDAGISYKGDIRYYDFKVKLLSEETATVVYCGDESGAVNTDRETGAVKKSGQTKPEDNYVLYNLRLTKNAEGVWQNTAGLAKRGSEACRP